MQIEKIRIQYFKSIEDVEFRPASFSVLVGPNNSGKSNIVSAFGFLSELYSNGPKWAIDQYGGLENILYRGNSSSEPKITFEVTVTTDWESIRAYSLADRRNRPEIIQGIKSVSFYHRFSIVGSGTDLISDFTIAEEQFDFRIVRSRAKRLLQLLRKDNRIELNIDDAEKYYRLLLPFPARQRREVAKLFLGTVGTKNLAIPRLASLSPTILQFSEFMSKIRTYQLSPIECRAPAVPTSSAVLGRHGANLPSLVYLLKHSQPESWAIVLENMMSIVPDLSNISVVPTEDRRWRIKFDYLDPELSWTADEVSDGTIRSLAMLVSTIDTRNSLSAIEEPENAVHPWILRVLVNVARTVVKEGSRHQILMTTHSPVLIDQLRPNEIFVVWKSRGSTKLMPLLGLDPTIRGQWQKGLVNISEILDSGLLYQTVPG